MCRASVASRDGFEQGAPAPDLPVLGVGITYSASIEPLLRSHPHLVDVLEFEPQTTWVRRGGAGPYVANSDALAVLATLPGRKLVHSVGAPVGGTVRPELAQLALLRESIQLLDSPWASEHLSFNQTSEFATGFLLPPRQTLQNVRVITESIRELQSGLGVPVCVETGVSYLRPRPDELPDGEFVARVVEGAGCGLLLDLHNIYTNSVNGRQPIDEYIDQLPLERVWEVHLAGGMEQDGFYLDAHSGAIPDALCLLTERLMPRLTHLRAMIFEIYPSFVPVVGLDLVREQLERLRALWKLRVEPPSRTTATTGVFRSLPVAAGVRLEPESIEIVAESPAAWECALGALVIGKHPGHGADHSNLLRDLEHDPGIRVVQSLIFAFRASMIVGVLRLSSRLMMICLSPPVFRAILNDYCRCVSPQMYASLEASAFAEYLSAANLHVPRLDKLLEFECAAAAALIDHQSHIVRFDFEPIPLLRALAEGRLPDEEPRRGAFEIELTPGTVGPTAVADPDNKLRLPSHH